MISTITAANRQDIVLTGCKREDDGFQRLMKEQNKSGFLLDKSPQSERSSEIIDEKSAPERMSLLPQTPKSACR